MGKNPEISRIMFVGFDETFQGEVVEEPNSDEAIFEVSENIINDNIEDK